MHCISRQVYARNSPLAASAVIIVGRPPGLVISRLQDSSTRVHCTVHRVFFPSLVVGATMPCIELAATSCIGPLLRYGYGAKREKKGKAPQVLGSIPPQTPFRNVQRRQTKRGEDTWRPQVITESYSIENGGPVGVRKRASCCLGLLDT